MSEFDHASESFRNVPQASEDFRKVPKDAESFGNVPKLSERKESHTLTVREAARMFEAAGVPRTERSITNWCHPNKLGVCRLDSYFDPNEGKFFVTPQSVEVAIKEEQAKVAQNATASDVGNIPKRSETDRRTESTEEDREPENVKVLRQKIFDLQITNQGKDYFIDRLQQERERFDEKLIAFARRVGELESKLLQLEPSSHRDVVDSEPDGTRSMT
jgi:hypothetical protein